MGHYLQALLIPGVAWRQANIGTAPVHSVRIGADLVLIPLTDELFDFVVGGDQSLNEYEGVFWKYHPAVQEFGASIAGEEAFGYIETEYFGGGGMQAAGAWRASSTLVAPRQAKIGPINDVLRSLGVVRLPGIDEFETVGLDRLRQMDDFPRTSDLAAADESPFQIASARLKRISFARPGTRLSPPLFNAIVEILARSKAIEEAYFDSCSINGEPAEDVLVLGVADDASVAHVMNDTLPRLQSLLPAAEHLDVLPFRVRDLPQDARILQGRIYVRTRGVRPWWKLWWAGVARRLTTR